MSLLEELKKIESGEVVPDVGLCNYLDSVTFNIQEEEILRLVLYKIKNYPEELQTVG